MNPDRIKAIKKHLEDFNKRLKEVDILPLPEYLDVTRLLWDCSYIYYPNRYDQQKSYSLPPQAGGKLIEKIREEISSPVVLRDDKGYWEIPAPKGVDGVFKEKFSPTVILPKEYKLGNEHQIVFRNKGRGDLIEYRGNYKI